jgi:hypothetical protein
MKLRENSTMFYGAMSNTSDPQHGNEALDASSKLADQSVLKKVAGDYDNYNSITRLSECRGAGRGARNAKARAASALGASVPAATRL